MHACIAALSQGIPTIGIAYYRKFIGVFDSIGVGNMIIDVKSIDNDTAIKKIFTNNWNRKKAKSNIKIKVHSAKKKLYKTILRDIVLRS